MEEIKQVGAVLYKFIVRRNGRRNLRLTDAYKPRDCRGESQSEAARCSRMALSCGQTAKAAQRRTPIAVLRMAECRFTPLVDSSASTARPGAGGKRS